MTWLDDIKELRLPKLCTGSHYSPAEGLCAMEMVAFIERLPHSDRPECTCPVIAAYVRQLNDLLNRKDRQRLLEYLPRLVGTVSEEHEQERAEYLAWQAIRVFTPIALRKIGMNVEAERLAYFDGTLKDAADAADAAYAAYAADAAYAALDGVLQIGPQGNWSNYSRERVVELCDE